MFDKNIKRSVQTNIYQNFIVLFYVILYCEPGLGESLIYLIVIRAAVSQEAE